MSINTLANKYFAEQQRNQESGIVWEARDGKQATLENIKLSLPKLT